MKKKIIAVDFDGTLCESKWPEIGEANLELMWWLRVQQATGAKIILWTCRVGRMLDEAIAWCHEHGLIFDAVNTNLPEIIEKFGSDSRKIFADFYIDDKNMRTFGFDKDEKPVKKQLVTEVTLKLTCIESGTDEQIVDAIKRDNSKASRRLMEKHTKKMLGLDNVVISNIQHFIIGDNREKEDEEINVTEADVREQPSHLHPDDIQHIANMVTNNVLSAMDIHMKADNKHGKE